MKAILTAAALIAALALGACEMTHANDGANQTKKSLYDRLGGKPAITAVVDDFVNRLAADNRINQRFGKTDVPKFKLLLADQVCQATGGPCKYTGKSMPEAHKGMNISEDEFNWTGQHLAATLDKFKVPPTEKNELLTAIGGMQKEIVGL